MGDSTPIARPHLPVEAARNVLNVLASGWLTCGEHVAGLEREWCDYTGAAGAVAVTSCTAALQVALRACGVGPGVSVVVPALTWVATANAVALAGALPVFCDVDPDTFNVTPETMDAAARRVEGRGDTLAGFVPVHLFGAPCPMPAPTARRAGRTFTIEDAACGLGASLNGRHVGTMGDFGAFSFHPRKQIATGEGGMLTQRQRPGRGQLSDPAALIRGLVHHGSHPGHPTSHFPDFPQVGFNFRFPDVLAVLARPQLAYWRERGHAERAECAAAYTATIAAEGWPLHPQRVIDGGVHGWQAYVVRCADSVDRDALMRHLASCGIQTRPGTHAVHSLPAFGHSPESFPVATMLERQTLALPLWHGPGCMDAVERTCEALKGWAW